MSESFSTVIRPAAAILCRAVSSLVGGYNAITRHFSHRAAIANLRELDDGALHDIGLARSEIKAAVRGLIRPSGQRAAPWS